MIIYEIRNKLDNKSYVGKYSKCDNNEDFQKANYWGSGTYIKRAIKDHKKENFERKVLIKGIQTLEELDQKERLCIKIKNSKHPNGYNLTDGGGGLLNPTEETRKKISKGISGENSPTKRPEVRDKISQSNKYFYSTLEGEKRRKEQSETHWNCSGENNPMFGKCGEKSPAWGKKGYWTDKKGYWAGKKRPEISGENHPNFGKVGYWAGKKRPEISKKISEANRGEKNHFARKVILISPKGEKVELPYYKDFCLEHKLSPSHICAVLKGKLKHHKGWTGYYLDEK